MTCKAATTFAVATLLLCACAAKQAVVEPTPAAITAPAVATSIAPTAPVPAPASSDKPASNDNAASPAYNDPVTGELRAPTAAELAAASAGTPGGADVNKSVKTVAAPEEITLPGGETMVRYGDGSRVEERVCLQKDGSLTSVCPPDKAQKAVAPPTKGSKP